MKFYLKDVISQRWRPLADIWEHNGISSLLPLKNNCCKNAIHTPEASKSHSGKVYIGFMVHDFNMNSSKLNAGNITVCLNFDAPRFYMVNLPTIQMIRCPRCIILWHFQWKTWTVETTGIFYLMCYFLHSVQNKRKIYWNKWPFDKLKSSDRYPWSCELNNVFKSVSAHIHSKILPWRTEGIFASSISAILFKTGINWHKIGSNF